MTQETKPLEHSVTASYGPGLQPRYTCTCGVAIFHEDLDDVPLGRRTEVWQKTIAEFLDEHLGVGVLNTDLAPNKTEEDT